MRTTSTTVITAALLLATLTACSDSDDVKASTKPSETTISQADRDAARKAAGLPPEPNAEATAAYIKALNAIDPRIVKPGKDDQAVSRGISQCGSIKTTPKDRAKLVELTLDRFTISTRLPDINNADTGGKVLDVVHKNLCPDF
ncbi:hypothetical protein [Streptomyces sp. NPDC048445]|uniref:hypothetical protein n=1 Tax=Streptomyces sp. NPDC048445 TaxID=3365553 RepID=UPI0037213712